MVNSEPMRVRLRRGVVTRENKIDHRAYPGLDDVRDVGRCLGKGPAETEGVGEGLVEETVPGEAVPRGVVDPDHRVGGESLIVLAVEREHLRVHDFRTGAGYAAGTVQADQSERDVEGVVRLQDGGRGLGPDDLVVRLVP